MNKEKQRIAIAEACGWTSIQPHNDWHYGLRPKNNGLGDAPPARLPDYLNDLNAMHEAEKALGDLGKWWSYCDHLKSIVKMTKGSESYVAATAAERAEAFLRALNKWED